MPTLGYWKIRGLCLNICSRKFHSDLFESSREGYEAWIFKQYFGHMTLAQPIRLLLNYVGEDFEDVRHMCLVTAPEYSRDSWFKVKFTLGLPIPNLPYYIDGDIKITQTNAILRYIARKHNLCKYR
ncbi:hypothetical protein KUTeg_020656 [Tegillarca granosa]|uniref:glutathione transferase n=1 Tax=Tegillarca granosa TaxID=220873 RepID=A0ABQ9E8J3_TEGGR|nr:hypothetical protein KUTeg_020656 [Tegillarca granosa]